jgi:hypothetical protein
VTKIRNRQASAPRTRAAFHPRFGVRFDDPAYAVERDAPFLDGVSPPSPPTPPKGFTVNEKTAQVHWEGQRKQGQGQISTATGALASHAYGYASCFEDDRRAPRPAPEDNDMTLPIVARKAVSSTLAQQKADFTAEGAPPPGEVSSVSAVTAEPMPQLENHTVARIRGTIKLQRPSRARYP